MHSPAACPVPSCSSHSSYLPRHNLLYVSKEQIRAFLELPGTLNTVECERCSNTGDSGLQTRCSLFPEIDRFCCRTSRYPGGRKRRERFGTEHLFCFKHRVCPMPVPLLWFVATHDPGIYEFFERSIELGLKSRPCIQTLIMTLPEG